jgi:amino-acid N-acetyltransferase
LFVSAAFAPRTTVELRDLTAEDMPRARALLASCELPTDDLDDASIALVGAFDGGALVGVIGLQSCGDAGLLRSLAVDPAHRDHGVARALCDRVSEVARAREMRELWLLTTTAEAYFTRLGFMLVEREAAPAQVRATTQFASLCPATARVMRRQQ